MFYKKVFGILNFFVLLICKDLGFRKNLVAE